MAPAVKVQRVERTTRSSTRAQTSKSYQDEAVTTKATTGRIVKKRKSSSNVAQKTRKTAETESKPATDTKSRQEDKPKVTAATPSSPTTLTITSDLVNKPIECHQYSPASSETPSKTSPPFIFTHGAGGTLSAPAVTNFCNGFISTSATPLLAFQGSSNLGARVKGFHACHEHMHAGATDLVFGGRSLGARAAVVAATEIANQEDGKGSGKVKLVLVSYPLQGPKDVRDGILLDLPEGVEVLFIAGDRDDMCPLELLDGVRRKMKAKSRLVVVRDADHGMNVKPARKTKDVGEETGRVAARWLSGGVEIEGETLYVGNED